MTVNSQIPKNKIPILGEIAAGSLLMAEENVIGSVNYPHSEETKELFALLVSGDSMIDEGLHEKDFVIITFKSSSVGKSIPKETKLLNLDFKKK